MSQETVIYLARETLATVLLVSIPMLSIGMLVGIIVSILQATTQIQEQTLTFVPKIIAIMISVILFGPWMLSVITQFTQNLFAELPYLIN